MTRAAYVRYSTFYCRKKALPEPHACAVGNRAFRGLYALPSVGPKAQRAGGLRARMGDEGKAVGCVPPTALLSEPRTHLVDSSRRHEIITRHGLRVILPPMLALSDNQLAAVMTAAGKLPTEKRGAFLERVVARLSLSPGFTAAEFADAMHSALRGLIQEKSTA
jgi:hypothetical protein